MATGMTRREAREAVFELLFESEFTPERAPEDVLALACVDRDLDKDAYVVSAYFGTMQHLPVLDVLLGRFSHGWKTDRMSRVSRAVLRLCTYEMLYCDDIPVNVSLNEAVELTKKFDDPKARAFVNGVLHSIKSEIEQKGVAQVIKACESKVLTESQVTVSGEASDASADANNNE